MPSSIPGPVALRRRCVALVGNPNTGKSTLFNALTGFRQRVANYPGVTVEKRSGPLRVGDRDAGVDLIDLPGAYSLGPRSEDEAIVLDVLSGRMPGTATPDALVAVVDAANLARNLFLTTQLLELGKPVVVALNMIDEAETAGLRLDAAGLSRELGVPVVPVIARQGVGVADLAQALEATIHTTTDARVVELPDIIRREARGLSDWLQTNGELGSAGTTRAEVLQLLLSPGGLHEHRAATRFGGALLEELAARRARIGDAGYSLAEVEAQVRYAWIGGVLSRVSSRVHRPRRRKSELIDRVLTHRVIGLIIFLALMGVCFQAIYTWAGPLMAAVDGVFVTLGNGLSGALPAGALRSLIVDGVIAGVGAVLVFLPQILILFLFIAILEDCGYMARAAFLLDRWMGLLGLTGKSFIPLLSSFACAVPGILSTRTIEDRRDRFVTILIAPLMSCSARLPVYILLIGAFIPATPVLFGWVSIQAMTLLALYCIGVVVAIIVAFVLKRTLFKGETQSFLLELPTYKLPSLRTVFFRVYEQGKAFCVSAGTIIFAVTVVIWALGYYPHSGAIADRYEAMRVEAEAQREARLQALAESLGDGVSTRAITEQPAVAAVLDDIARAEAKFEAYVAVNRLKPGSETYAAAARAHADWAASLSDQAGAAGTAAREWLAARAELDARLGEIDRAEAGAYLRESLLGRMGRFIEPVVEPLGWDWRIGTAAIAAFPAREVVIATMGTIYNLGSDEDESSVSLRDKLHEATWPDGRKVFSIPVALSIMVFFALCCQCGGTLAVIKRETGSWKYPVITFTYMTALAYVAALATYQIGSRML